MTSNDPSHVSDVRRSKVRRGRRNKVRASPTKIYEKQMQKCEKMFHQLVLDRSATWFASPRRPPNTACPSPSVSTSRLHNLRNTKSAPAQTDHRTLPIERHLIKTAWAGLDHLRVPSQGRMGPGRRRLNSERTSYKSEDFSNTDVNCHLTPEGLCEVLRSRGLGDPRTRKVWAPDETQILPQIFKRKRKALKIPYYMEKIKGKARMDCDIANSKAATFCEQQRMRSKYLRMASANYNYRLLVYSSNSGSASPPPPSDEPLEDDVLDDEDEVPRDEDLFIRIQSWIEDVDKAMGTMEDPINYKPANLSSRRHTTKHQGKKLSR